MIKLGVLHLALLFINNSYSQISGILLSSETKEGISYANIWLSNKGTGTTSTYKGAFSLNEASINDTLIISALGFEKKIYPITRGVDTIELIPLAVELKEFIVSTPKIEKELEVGTYKKSLIHSFMSSQLPTLYARKFDYNSTYNTTPFLKSIKVLTKNKLDSTIINVRILSVNEDSSPGKSLIDSNLIVKVKNGKNNTKIDLSKLLLRIPENGFYIAFEWLLLEENKYYYNVTEYESKVKVRNFSYQPYLGTVEQQIDNEFWMYHNGKWIQHEFSNGEKLIVPAITLTLSN